MEIDQCTSRSLFLITYSDQLKEAFLEMQLISYDVYVNILIYFSPINILANLLSALILVIIKELRNPYNVILGLMCILAIVPLIIRASLIYRKLAMLDNDGCNPEMLSYSMALHALTEFNSWAPFRAAYTWLAAVLTFSRFRALRSKGKWEASYCLVLTASVIVIILSAAAGVPMYLINIISSYRLSDMCEADPSLGNVIVWYPTWSTSMYENDCLLYRIMQWISGIVHNTLPSLVLLIFTLLLTFELRNARKGHLAVAGRSAKKSDDGLRAARILSLVAILTLLSELPQGLASLANALFPVGFQNHYTEKFLMIWATIQILTTSCNLLITLAMSKVFRKAVSRVVCFWRKNGERISRPTVSVTSVASNKSVKNQGESRY